MAASSGEPDLPPSGAWGRVPDDASELEPDRLAWLAEQRAMRRRRWLRRLLLTRQRERLGLSGPIAFGCLAVTTLVALVVVAVVPPSSPSRPIEAPLAVVPVASVTGATPAPAVETPGGPVIGHLLPDVRLQADTGRVSAVNLRPAVLVLVPTACACSGVLGAIYRQSLEFRLDLWLVGGPGSADRLATLDADAVRGGARWAVDGAGVLAMSLAARGLTLVTVRADGVIADLGRDLSHDESGLPDLEPLLARLTTPSR